jgi:tetratricopeptide (TPR) repeat protein
LGLRWGGYGHSTRFFKPLTINGKQMLVENERFGLRFFPPELARSPAPVAMPAKKGPDTFRIFVFGESAALGDPRPAYGPSRYLQVLLEERFPGRKFEVVNTGVTAINSHAILPIARECAKLSGDAWIVYMGNNEMVGPFGATSVFGSRSPPLFYIRLSLAVQELRLGQFVMAGLRLLSSPERKAPSWGGMKMFLDSIISPEDPGRKRVYWNFEANLRDILKAGRRSGAHVVLSSVAVNLRDCPPFASVTTTNDPVKESAFARSRVEGIAAANEGRWSDAEANFRRVVEQDQLNAEARYRLAAALFAQKKPDAACDFARARDLDALPFRTDSVINHLVAKAAENRAGERFSYSDAEALFAENSPGNIAGAELFLEHVHFSFEGSYLLGRAWAEQLLPALAGFMAGPRRGEDTAALPKETQPGFANWASREVCEQRLALTDWNRFGVYDEMLSRLSQPPFVNQLDHAEQVARVRGYIKDLRARMDPEAVTAARNTYQAALQRSPTDHRLHENYAEFLELSRNFDSAVAEWQRVIELIPHHHAAYFHAGRLLLQAGKLDDARQFLERTLAMRPDAAEAWLRLGQVHAARGDALESLAACERALALFPTDPRIHYQIGKAHSKLTQRAQALASFREAVRLRPSFWEARYALGEELAFEGKRAEAREQFLEVIRLRPEYPMARFNLAVALYQEGQVGEAIAQLEETVRLDPANQQAVKYLNQMRARR